MAKKRGKQGVSARPRGEPLEWVTAREVATTLYRKLCIQSESRGRVAAGSYPPAAPTDPGVPHSGTRLLR